MSPAAMRAVGYGVERGSQYRCYPNPDGATAWGLVASNALVAGGSGNRRDDDRRCCDLSEACTHLDVRLLFVDSEGTAHWGPAMPLSLANDCHFTFEPLRFFDFDGDEISEVVIKEDRWMHEGGPLSEELLIYTMGDGRVSPYPPSEAFAAVQLTDVDSDGRPDLVLSHVYSVDISTCSKDGYESVVYGPRFVAHCTEDGRFSLTDAVAQAHLKKSCPGPPRSLRPLVRNGAMDQELFRNALVCALLWGQKDRAKNALDACGFQQDTRKCYDRAGREVYQYDDPVRCADVAALRRWLAEPPPVLLQKTAERTLSKNE